VDHSETELLDGPGPTPAGHMCLAIGSIIQMALQSGVITEEEHNKIYRAVWAVEVHRAIDEETIEL
jgi:hypothetical protein